MFFSFNSIDIVSNVRYNREIFVTIDEHKSKRQYDRKCDKILHNMFNYVLIRRFFFSMSLKCKDDDDFVRQCNKKIIVTLKTKFFKHATRFLRVEILNMFRCFFDQL